MPFRIASAFCSSGFAPLSDAIAIAARKAERMMVRFASLDATVAFTRWEPRTADT